MPSKPKRRNSGDSRFMFVNDNAQTRDTKDPERNKQKQKHVQRIISAERRQQLQRSLSNSATYQISVNVSISAKSQDNKRGQAGGSTSHRSNSSDAVLEPSQRETASNVESQLAATTGVALSSRYVPGQFLDTIGWTEGTSSTESAESSAPVSPPATPLSHLLRARSIHPLFSGAQKILEDWTPPLVRHYNTILLPEQFFAETQAVPMSRIRHANAIHNDMRDVMSSPDRLYSFLAAAATRMIHCEGRLLLPGIGAQDPQRVVLYFKTKALEAVRQQLEKGNVSPKLVVGVVYLFETAFFAHNHNAADLHLRAVRSMMSNLGGIQKFDKYFQDHLIFLQWAASIKSLRRPQSDLDFDPGPGSQEIREIRRLLRTSQDIMGSNLYALVEAGKIRPAIMQATQDLVEITRFNGWLRARPYQAELYTWQWHRHIAVGYKILSLADELNLTEQEEAFRIALVCFTALERCPTSGRRCAAANDKRLMWQLQTTDLEHLWHPQTDWLLWISVIGGLVSKSEFSVDWFAHVAGRAAEKLEIRDVHRLEEVMGGYLYDKQLQEERLTDFFQRMQRR